MFKGRSQITQEVTTIKTPHENLIEFLEKIGLKYKADNLRKDATSLDLGYNNIGEPILKTNWRISKKKSSYSKKKAESLNAAGDDLFNKAEYDKAIEKYKAAIKIKKELERYNYTKENLYEKNKTNVEKNMKNNRKL